MTGGYLQIGEVAERAGLSLRTVRYYEEQGLVTPAKRSEGGFRLYTEEQVERLLVIRGMKPLGFTLHEMHDLLAARAVLGNPDAAAADRDAAADRLRGFADAAEERCRDLRSTLEKSEAFARGLRQELGGARQTPAVSG
jgi:DNA-binding transcriptional MerR regulator